MSETTSPSTFRCLIDGLASDIRFIRRTTGVLLFFSILFSLLGLFSLFDGKDDFQTKLASDGLQTLIAWILTFWFWALRQGWSEAFSRNIPNILKGATVLILVSGTAHYAFLKFWLFEGFSLISQKAESIAVIYSIVLAATVLLWVTYRKAMRLSSFRPASDHLPPVRLLERKRFVKSHGQRGFVLPPIDRWPLVFAWTLIATVYALLGSFIAALLTVVTEVLSYVIPVPKLLPLLGPGIVRPLLEGSSKAAHMARRYQSVDARELLAADPRPPILLLRSFADDNRQISVALDFEWMAQGGRTFEEVLASQLDRYGPVVAIGKPGEIVPSAGAAREYLADDAWQARVEELVAASAAIVVIAGKTPFLRWELARIESLGALSKMLLVIPAEGKNEAADRLVTLVENLLGTRVSELINNHLHTDAMVAQFGRESLLEIASQNRQPQDYAVAVDIAMQVSLGMAV